MTQVKSLAKRATLGLAALLSTLSFYAQAQSGPMNLGGFYLADFAATPAPMQLTFTRVLMEQNGRYEIRFAHAPEFYRERLLNLAAVLPDSDRAFARTPLAHHFAAVAVLHCDWRNHFEPLEFAEKYLGPIKLARYGAIFPEAVAQLKQNCPNQLPLPASLAESTAAADASEASAPSSAKPVDAIADNKTPAAEAE